MAVVPVLPPVASGFYSSSSVSAIVAAVNFVMNKPAFQVRQIVSQTLTTGIWTPITFTNEELDTDPAGGSGHDNATNPSRYTANYAGRYPMSGCVAFAANAAGQRATRWAVNGTAIDGSVLQVNATAANEVIVPASDFSLFLNVGDYVELQGWQNTGGNLATLAFGQAQSRMSGQWERLT